MSEPNPGIVTLRVLEADDLPTMFEMQLDPESNRMAVTNPRTAEAFDMLWAENLQNPTCISRAILRDGVFVGWISCFRQDGEANIGYWIGREHWGKGIASEALKLLLTEVEERPLYASAATSNPASLRVLQKCGFEVVSVQTEPASDRYPESEVASYILKRGQVQF